MSSKKALAFTLMLLTLISCHQQGIRSFWKTHSIDYSDIDAAQEQFADFAELTVAAPEKEALAAMDVLFDQLKKDEVAYYIYADWMVGAFYNLLSPCRNPQLFTKAVQRMIKDGVMTDTACEPFLRQRDWIQYNKAGQPATVPGLTAFDGRTLVLVLDLGCSSCREALEKLGADPRWTGLRHVAVGCGYGPVPSVPGWEYLTPDDASVYFDPRLTPIFFIVGPDGLVEEPYSLAL